ncbi:MAG: DUF4366 domain-containing protein [Oscillospiraceae bacterium]|nr:DUF4366 domain-containing protein [Oscillospiraceae bacterium]
MKRISKFLTSATVLCLIAGASPALSASAEETPAVTSVVSSESTIIAGTLPVPAETEPAVTTGENSVITPENFSEQEADGELVLPPGNGTLLEDVLDENVNRQFLTIQSRNGNTFYIVIDKDDTGHNNVYFMNQVDEYDLLAFADHFPEDDKDGSKKKAETASTGNKNGTTPEPQEDAVSEDPVSEPSVRPTTSGTNLLLPAVIILTLIGGAAFYFFRMKDSGKKSSKKHGFDDEDDFDDDEAADEDD